MFFSALIVSLGYLCLRPLKSSRQALHVLRNECNEIVILCWTNLCDASSRWDWIFIFIFRNFEARTPANITGLGFATNWPLTRVPQQKSCFKSERNELFGSRGSRASDKIAISLSAASQILNKAKDFFESLKYHLRMQPTNLVGGAVRKEFLWRQCDSSIVFLRKNRWCSRVRIMGTLSLRASGGLLRL